MTRCPEPFCGGQVFRLPPDDMIHVAAGATKPSADLCCSLCGRGIPTRAPEGSELRNRVTLPVARGGEGGT